MKLRYLRAFIVLLAGLIALLLNMKTGKNVTVSLLIVLVVILVFYVIATLLVEILQRGMEQKPEDAEEEDTAEDGILMESEPEGATGSSDLEYEEEEEL